MKFFIDPVLVSLGPISIRYYGLVYALGFLALYILLIKNKSKINFTEEECSELLLVGGLSMLIFGRLFHFIFDNPSLLLQNPLEFFAIWHGGIAFYGSAVGAAIGGIGYVWKKKKLASIPLLGDLIGLVVAFTLVFGRIANFINQELVGTVTTVAQTPWCVNFINWTTSTSKQLVWEGVCRHPYQLYASFSHVVMAFILLYIFKKTKNGNTLWGFIILYPLFRFIVDFWRVDIRYFGVTPWQYFSLAAFIILLISWFTINKKRKEKNTHEKEESHKNAKRTKKNRKK